MSVFNLLLLKAYPFQFECHKYGIYLIIVMELRHILPIQKVVGGLLHAMSDKHRQGYYILAECY